MRRHPEISDPQPKDGEDSDAMSEASVVSSDSNIESEHDGDNNEDSMQFSGQNNDVLSSGDEGLQSTKKGRKLQHLRSPSRKSARPKTKAVYFSPEKDHANNAAVRERKYKKGRQKCADEENRAIKKIKKERSKNGMGDQKARTNEEKSENSEVAKLLIQLLQKQNELIEMMHKKGQDDDYAPTPVRTIGAATTKKVTNNTVDRMGTDQSNFVPILPKRDYIPVGDHDMEAFIRHNISMARLIEENADLRRDKLIRDMVYRANQH